MNYVYLATPANAISRVSLILFALAPLLTFGCSHDDGSRRAADPRPNIILIVTDDQRPDTIAALGNDSIRTPHLDRLVQQGTVFLRATCSHPLCVPSRAELLTGLTGFRNGVHPPRNDANLDHPTLPGLLADAGYETWHVGKWMVKGLPSSRGYTDSLALFRSSKRQAEPQYDYRGREVTGFLGWKIRPESELFATEGTGLTPDISTRFADAAIDFINRKTSKPYFLHVNFTAPHDPLLLPPGYESAYKPGDVPLPGNFAAEHPFDHGNANGRDERLLPKPLVPEDVQQDLAAYYAVIEHMDAEIGRIVAAVNAAGQSEQTIVIFTSDHGLALGSHGLMGKQNMYEHTINVPLVFAGPAIDQGRRINAQCYLRDLFPTICDFANVTPPQHLDAKSLLPVLRGQSEELYPFIVGYFADAQRMIRTDTHKYIWYPAADREQLFDLSADPLELNSLNNSPELATLKQSMRADLLQWLTDREDPVAIQGGKNPGLGNSQAP